MRNVYKNILIAALLFTVAALMLGGCNSATTVSPDDRQDHTYELQGILAKDFNRHAFRCQAMLTRNDTALSSATVVIGTDTLAYASDRYTLEISPAGAYQSGAYNLYLRDSVLLNTLVQTTLPDSFAVIVTDPASRINAGGNQVSIQWTGSNMAEGYAMAVVPNYKAYTGTGWSDWVATMATGGTIPPEAFRWRDGINVDTGWYYIYVYAYTGSPQQSLSGANLPTPLPGQLIGNVDQEDLAGNLGAVLVSVRDSVQVRFQP